MDLRDGRLPERVAALRERDAIAFAFAKTPTATDVPIGSRSSPTIENCHCTSNFIAEVYSSGWLTTTVS